jgi:hypothetical protein
MEGMGNKPRLHRRAFTPEFRAEIVELCQRGDRSVGQVARDFDLTETAAGEPPAPRGCGDPEAATAFFAKETR